MSLLVSDQRPTILPPEHVHHGSHRSDTEAVHGVSFQLHAGELLGLGGLRGQGQHHVLLALFGADCPTPATLRLTVTRAHFTHPRQAMQHGWRWFQESVPSEGLLLNRSILENFLIPSWRDFGFPLRIQKARRQLQLDSRKVLVLKMGGLDDPVSSLSGGNAQKVVIGKWLLRDPQMFDA